MIPSTCTACQQALTGSPYRLGQHYLCPRCWEDYCRREARTALDRTTRDFLDPRQVRRIIREENAKRHAR